MIILYFAFLFFDSTNKDNTILFKTKQLLLKTNKKNRKSYSELNKNSLFKDAVLQLTVLLSRISFPFHLSSHLWTLLRRYPHHWKTTCLLKHWAMRESIKINFLTLTMPLVIYELSFISVSIIPKVY